MAKLPSDVSGRELRAALEKAGFTFRRQRGSHMVLRREASGELPGVILVVPDHKRLRRGTLRQILSRAGLSVAELRDLL